MCISVLTLKDGSKVPCSKCPECKSRRVSAWSLRLVNQGNFADTAHFITLTYGEGEDEDGCYPRRTSNGFKTISKRDVQLFVKRLRFLQSKSGGLPIKYYFAGEYGSRTARPHYHAIIFNADVNNFTTAWNLGHVHIGTVSEASIGYCLKYISKGRTVPRHSRDDRQSEFSLMSKGLGAAYLTAAKLRWHKFDVVNRVYAVIEDGKKVSLPRYYKDRIYTDQERDDIRSHYKQFHFDQYMEQNPGGDHAMFNEIKRQQKMILEGSKRQAKYLNSQNENL